MSDSTPAAPAPAATPKSSAKTIVLLVLLVLLAGLVFFYAMPKLKSGMKNPIVQDAVAIYPQLKEMESLTQSQIEDQAEKMDAAALLADPTGLEGRYVVTEGSVNQDESSLVSQNLAMNAWTGDSEKYKGCILDDGLVVIDLTGEMPILSEGARIKCFGKVLAVNLKDVYDLPWVGEDLKKEFGNVEGMSDQVVFFFSKGIQLLEPGGEPAEENPCAPAENPCTANPCNPCAPADNPCAANPCTPAENPCGANPCNPCAPAGNPCAPTNPCGGS